MAIIGQVEIPGQYTVQLAVNEKATHWYVTYGLQPVLTFVSAESAIKEFKDCALHAMGCAGWIE